MAALPAFASHRCCAHKSLAASCICRFADSASSGDDVPHAPHALHDCWKAPRLSMRLLSFQPV